MTAKLVEKLLLQFERLFFGAKRLGLVLLELFGDVALGVFDCLLADVVGGDFIGCGVVYLDIVAEYLVVSDFKIGYARPLGLLPLVILEPASSIFRN